MQHDAETIVSNAAVFSVLMQRSSEVHDDTKNGSVRDYRDQALNC